MSGAYLFQIFLVGLGGFIGSSLRFVVSGGVQSALPFTAFPFGTLVVNVAGCLAIGVLGGLADLRQLLDPSQRLFLLIGVLGGFTTFSAFAYDTFAMARDANLSGAFANILLENVLGVGAAWLGYTAARFG